jgi:hypothetical protein
LHLQGQACAMFNAVGLSRRTEHIALDLYRVILRSKDRDETNE